MRPNICAPRKVRKPPEIFWRTLIMRLPEEIRAQLRQPIIGQQLLLVQIPHQALKARSIWHRRTRPGRKFRAHLGAPRRTIFDLAPVFRRRQRLRRQIQDLVTLVVQRRFPAQPAATWGTNRQFMDHQVIGIFDPLQRLSGMTGLAPGFATTGSAQTLGVGLNTPA